MHFHQILEYEFLHYINPQGKVYKVETDKIGQATLITAEEFNAGAAQLYTHYDDDLEPNGTMIILGAAVGAKRIYPILNPSEENKWEEFFLTSVKYTMFRARVVGEDDRSCLTQVRYN